MPHHSPAPIVVLSQFAVHVLELRHWLRDHDIAQNSTFHEQDVNNA